MPNIGHKLDAKVLARVRRMRPGVVFTVRSFVAMDAGPRLNRMARAGHIRRLAPGIWHKPENNPLIGDVPPSSPAIAAAVAELRAEEERGAAGGGKGGGKGGGSKKDAAKVRRRPQPLTWGTPG